MFDIKKVGFTIVEHSWLLASIKINLIANQLFQYNKTPTGSQNQKTFIQGKSARNYKYVIVTYKRVRARHTQKSLLKGEDHFQLILGGEAKPIFNNSLFW